MTAGGVLAGGSVASSVRSTSARRDWRKSLRFMTRSVIPSVARDLGGRAREAPASSRHPSPSSLAPARGDRSFLVLVEHLARVERLGHRLPLRIGEDRLDFLFHFLEPLMAKAR